MSDNKHKSERTAIDDVRRVREKIARKYAGDLRRHVEETSRMAAQLRARLKVRPVPPADATHRDAG